jgi:hypothetical protein
MVAVRPVVARAAHVVQQLLLVKQLCQRALERGWWRRE